MMGLFAQRYSDPVHEISAVPFAFAGDTLDVFGINAEADLAWFHGCVSGISKLGKCPQLSSEEMR